MIENRALACAPCNFAKSNRLTAVDPLTGTTVNLFNPRTQIWDEHFRWADDQITLEGLTPTGRATVVALKMNTKQQKRARGFWVQANLLP